MILSRRPKVRERNVRDLQVLGTNTIIVSETQQSLCWGSGSSTYNIQYSLNSECYFEIEVTPLGANIFLLGERERSGWFI